MVRFSLVSAIRPLSSSPEFSTELFSGETLSWKANSFPAMVSNGVDTKSFPRSVSNVRVTYESSEAYQKSPRLLQLLIVFQVQTESSLVVASWSIYSARVRVVSTVVVRVMLD